MVRGSSGHGALMVWSHVTSVREPGQVRKEAAVSGRRRVPWVRLAGATDPGGARAVRGRRRVHGHIWFV